MSRVATGGSVLAALIVAYWISPVFAWAALIGTGVFVSLRRSRQVAPEPARDGNGLGL